MPVLRYARLACIRDASRDIETVIELNDSTADASKGLDINNYTNTWNANNNYTSNVDISINHVSWWSNLTPRIKTFEKEFKL